MLIESKKVQSALNYATIKHKGQYDKAGKPYINHPIYVANQFQTEEEQIIGLLHDTVEDTDATLSEIEEQFGEDVAQVIKILTHNYDNTYNEYIVKVSENAMATRIKLADLKNNMDLRRLKRIRMYDLKRWVKYYKARKYLLKTQEGIVKL